MKPADLKRVGLIEILTSYKDLCLEIEYFETLLAEIEQEWKVNRSTLIGHPNKKRTALPIDTITGEMDNLMHKHTNIEKLLDIKKRFKKQAEEIIKRFDGIEYKVVYLHFVERKSLKEIAEELGYSYDRIRHISSEVKREIR